MLQLGEGTRKEFPHPNRKLRIYQRARNVLNKLPNDDGASSKGRQQAMQARSAAQHAGCNLAWHAMQSPCRKLSSTRFLSIMSCTRAASVHAQLKLQ